jgi:hypothetical protein
MLFVTERKSSPFEGHYIFLSLKGNGILRTEEDSEMKSVSYALHVHSVRWMQHVST